VHGVLPKAHDVREIRSRDSALQRRYSDRRRRHGYYATAPMEVNKLSPEQMRAAA